jgi:hypothetical protein
MIFDTNLTPTSGYDEDTFEKLKRARQGSHYIIVYRDLSMFRNIYSQYTKRQIEEKNEIVLILPHYETIDTVRYVLSHMARIDVKKYEKQDSLLIIDSARAYFGSSIDIISFVKSLVNYADQIGKNGVTVLADMGSFFCYNKLNDLIEYETSLQRTSDIKAKGFCFYKRDDFNWRISRIQRKRLLDHHGRELMVAPTLTLR